MFPSYCYANLLVEQLRVRYDMSRGVSWITTLQEPTFGDKDLFKMMSDLLTCTEHWDFQVVHIRF